MLNSLALTLAMVSTSYCGGGGGCCFVRAKSPAPQQVAMRVTPRLSPTQSALLGTAPPALQPLAATLYWLTK